MAQLLERAVRDNPDGRALIYRSGARWETLTFQALLERCNRYTGFLREQGLERGQRALMMVPNGPDFVALTFAVFRVGALPVLIDPGMGLKPLLGCVAHARPDFLIGIRKAHLLRGVFRSAFSSVRKAIVTDGSFPGAVLLGEGGPSTPDMVNTHLDEAAGILFTSGSTGPAKGVVYRHGIFRAQVAQLRDTFGFRAGEVDMPGFPLFALFSTALGLTCVLPELNPSRPATCDPRKLALAIQEFEVNNLQGSPAIWKRLGQWCADHYVRLPSLKRLVTFGAPIPPALMAQWADIMPADAEFYTPYGATEALPLTNISAREILSETAVLSAAGAGTCVGRPLPGVEIAIVRITDEPLSAVEPLPVGHYGEVVVAGEVVTWEYDGLPEETNRAKVFEGDHKVWHRMGDMGYLDAEGRLWLLGRKSHRVENHQRYYPEQVEGMVNPHPRVARAALVGVGPRGQQTPVLVVESGVRPDARAELSKELVGVLSEHPLYRDVKRVLYHPSFPVDPRHNAKIHRDELAVWASKQR